MFLHIKQKHQMKWIIWNTIFRSKTNENAIGDTRKWKCAHISFMLFSWAEFIILFLLFIYLYHKISTCTTWKLKQVIFAFVQIAFFSSLNEIMSTFIRHSIVFTVYFFIPALYFSRHSRADWLSVRVLLIKQRNPVCDMKWKFSDEKRKKATTMYGF